MTASNIDVYLCPTNDVQFCSNIDVQFLSISGKKYSTKCNLSYIAVVFTIKDQYFWAVPDSATYLNNIKIWDTHAVSTMAKLRQRPIPWN